MNIKKYSLSIFLFFLVFLIFFNNVNVLAHGVGHEGEQVAEITPANIFINSASNVVWYASIALILLVVIAVIFKNKFNEREKKAIFFVIALLVVAVTGYLVIGSLIVNIISESKGPVHWHADYEIWICGKEVSIVKPKPPLNRIGTDMLHDHGDNRIHVEGIVIKKDLVSLGAFFRAIGGKLTEDEIVVPTEEGKIHKMNGDLCNGKEGKLYIFVNGKLLPSHEHASYVISPYERVPPGDMIKIVFSSKSLDEINPYIKTFNRTRGI